MARSTYKYYSFDNLEILNYIHYLTEHNNLLVSKNIRSLTLHQLNYYLPFNIYTGKWVIKKYFLKHHWNFKVGQFTKTRKPFFFRSKKKR